MKDSTTAVRDCPKFDTCSAPICPLDPDWRLRVYRKGEPICFYLLEYVKPDARAEFRGCIEVSIHQAIERSIESMSHRYAPLSRALERAKWTGSRMTTRKETEKQSRMPEHRFGVVGSRTEWDDVYPDDTARNL